MPRKFDLMSTGQVAAHVGVTIWTVARWAREGKLEPALRGSGETGALWFKRADVERLKRNREAMTDG